MVQPPGYVQNDTSIFFHLKKSLYGLLQAPRAWYAKMDYFLLDISFSRCHSDPNVYTKKVGSHLIILFLYVDVLILTGSDSKLLNHVKTNLKNKFEMKDFFFFSLSMLVTFIVTFTWMIVNQPLLPSSLESRFLPPVLILKLMPPCIVS